MAKPKTQLDAVVDAVFTHRPKAVAKKRKAKSGKRK